MFPFMTTVVKQLAPAPIGPESVTVRLMLCFLLFCSAFLEGPVKKKTLAQFLRPVLLRPDISSTMLCCALAAQSCPTLWDPMNCSLCPWNSPGKNTGVDCHFLLQRVFLTQELNPGLLHCRQILSHLSHQGSPVWVIVVSNLFPPYHPFKSS